VSIGEEALEVGHGPQWFEQRPRQQVVFRDFPAFDDFGEHRYRRVVLPEQDRAGYGEPPRQVVRAPRLNGLENGVRPAPVRARQPCVDLAGSGIVLVGLGPCYQCVQVFGERPAELGRGARRVHREQLQDERASARQDGPRHEDDPKQEPAEQIDRVAQVVAVDLERRSRRNARNPLDVFRVRLCWG
jgi:hypothetical protein